MPLISQQPEQFMVLMTGNTDSVQRLNPNRLVAHQHHDIVKLVESIPFDLILLDLNEHSHEIIAHIKAPQCINNKTPIIAIINQEDEAQRKHQYPSEFDDWLIKPFTEEQLENNIDLWQTKSLALDYIQILQTRTKNNQRLTLTIFEKLFEELPLQIQGIHEALKNKQYALAQEITHRLNGSASFCGLLDIQRPANALESSLLNHNHADISQQFLMLQQCTLHFTRLQKAIMGRLG